MTQHSRRTILKTAGASLLGTTLSGTASATSPGNSGINLLEASLSFEVPGEDNLDMTSEDRPPKYAIDTDDASIRFLSVNSQEERALKSSENIVNFQTISANSGSIGGDTINNLYLRNGQSAASSISIPSTDGYDIPVFNIDMKDKGVVKPQTALGSSRREVANGFTEIELPRQTVTTTKRVVTDERANIESELNLEAGRVVERKEEQIEVKPYLTVAYHPNLDVITGNE